MGIMHARRVLAGMPVAALATGGPPIAGRACVPHAALCPCFYFSVTPQDPPLSLDFTVCMCCGSFFFPGMWPPRDPLSFLLIYTGVIQQQQLCLVGMHALPQTFSFIASMRFRTGTGELGLPWLPCPHFRSCRNFVLAQFRLELTKLSCLCPVNPLTIAHLPVPVPWASAVPAPGCLVTVQ